METVETISLMLGAAWASGINLYAAILVIGFMGATGRLELPEGLELLSDPLVMLAAGAMYVVEFFADNALEHERVGETIDRIGLPAFLEALDIAAERGLTLPLVYNTGTYDAMDTLELLDGVDSGCHGGTLATVRRAVSTSHTRAGMDRPGLRRCNASPP